MKEIVRVLRVIEYIGKREWVERTVASSIQGTKIVHGGGEIRAATIGAYPDVLVNAGMDIMHPNKVTTYPEIADMQEWYTTRIEKEILNVK